MKKNYYILMFYFILAVFFWGLPIKFDFVNRLLNMGGDPAFYLWSLKWWPYAISHGLNPFLAKASWAPFGQNLAWTTSCPSIAILMWPITNLFGANPKVYDENSKDTSGELLMIFRAPK
ncbi:MAG: hypothetical protein QXU98_07560 [Candidatus Parvarchaeota archaeon]